MDIGEARLDDRELARVQADHEQNQAIVRKEHGSALCDHLLVQQVAGGGDTREARNRGEHPVCDDDLQGAGVRESGRGRVSARAGSTSGVKAVRGSEALVAQVPTVICFLDNMYGMDGRKTQGLEFF